MTTDSDLAYVDLVERVREVAATSIPTGGIMAVVSRGDERLLQLEGRVGWHFPQTEAGVYLGHHPADDSEAIARLEQVRRKGAEFLLLPATASWWLEHYRTFAQHLDRTYPEVVRDPEACVIYDLRRPIDSRRPLQVGQLNSFLDNLLPGDATVAVASGGDPTLIDLGGRRAWHFPRAVDGTYAEPLLADPVRAVANLEDMRDLGAEYLVLPTSEICGLELYEQVRLLVTRRYRMVADQRFLGTVFSLEELRTESPRDRGTHWGVLGKLAVGIRGASR